MMSARKKVPLVFAHGWGFHGGVWSQIAPCFPDYEVSYFGADYIRGGPLSVDAIPDRSIVVGFSFGLVQALLSKPVSLYGVVSICGFDSLENRGRGDAVRNIQAGFARNPYAQMRGFWSNCGIARFADDGNLNDAELERGLRDMLELDARPQLNALTCPVLALASRDDLIVPIEVTDAVFSNADLGGASVVMSETGGHALPLTRGAWCVAQINEFLEAHVA